MSLEKRTLLKSLGLLLSAREKILNNFKSKIFPTKNIEPQPETDFDPTKQSRLTDFWKKVI